MSIQSIQGITFEDILLEDIKNQTVELPLTEDLMLRITPQDWAAEAIILPESLCIKESSVESLKKKLKEAAK